MVQPPYKSNVQNQKSSLTHWFNTPNAFQNGMSHLGSTNNQGGDTFPTLWLIGGQAKAVRPQAEALGKSCIS